MGERTMRRYTNLASAIHILRSNRLTLLDPARWDDQNDAYFIRRYKEEQKAKTVLALCFARSIEQYHHWRVFAQGTDGTCLEFDEAMLLLALDRCKGVLHRPVSYRTVEQVEGSPPTTEDLPFLKRKPFRDEQEYRVIYVDRVRAANSMDCPIPAECIKKVILSPWMPAALEVSLTDTLRSLVQGRPVKIYQSRLIEYERWKSVADKSE